MDQNVKWLVVGSDFTATMFKQDLLMMREGDDLRWYDVKSTSKNKEFVRKQLMTVQDQKELSWVMVMLQQHHCIDRTTDVRDGIIDVTMVLPQFAQEAAHGT